jgi:hypothetical protein
MRALLVLTHSFSKWPFWGTNQLIYFVLLYPTFKGSRWPFPTCWSLLKRQKSTVLIIHRTSKVFWSYMEHKCSDHTWNIMSVLIIHGTSKVFRSYMEHQKCSDHTWNIKSVLIIHGTSKVFWSYMEHRKCSDHTWNIISVFRPSTISDPQEASRDKATLPQTKWVIWLKQTATLQCH